MDEKEIQRILMEMLYSALNETLLSDAVCEQLTHEVIISVYHLAQKHALSHLVSRCILKNDIKISPKLALDLQRVDIRTVYKHERMNLAFNEIGAVLEDRAIDYIPLKGSVIRLYYPEEDMRTSCDVDVLIRESDLESAIQALENKGYSRGERHYHDVSLYSPNGTHLELHFNIQEHMDNLDVVLKDAWKYAVRVEGHRYELRQDFFIFHIYAHMAYHFLAGGCGIRSLMDIWVLEHRMKADYRSAKRFLEKAGIYRFAEEMNAVANQCFSGNDCTDPILAYIWRGGVYGSKKNKVAVQKKQTGSSFAYIMKLIFLPYRSMIVSYPILKRLPFLLPFCWGIRGFKALFLGKATRLKLEISRVNRVSEEDMDEVEKIYLRFGLQ